MAFMSYTSLRKSILKRRPDLPIKEVEKAYEFAKQAHGNQKRYSGESYIMHPVAVTEILLDLNPDLAAVQASLLHDVTEDTPVTLTEIEHYFGKEVSALVQGLEKLAVVKVRKDDFQEEKWRKMFLAMAKDIRIVFIKLADRLHNMRTLSFVPVHKQERIARETLLIHAGIASRLGIYQIKSELEDLCFRYLYPEAFEWLSESLASHRVRSEECMDFATAQVEQILSRQDVVTREVQGRMKHLWSIYQKMQKKEARSLQDIYDLFAVRVVLPNHIKAGKEHVTHVYSSLGILHGELIPLQDRFKDYIAVPKPNGYRSLHTTVLGLGGDIYDEPTEIQLRTIHMHEEAEIGIASHWSYKLGKKMKDPAKQKEEEQMAWLRGLADASSTVNLNLYPDEIFVLTPGKKLIELPQGANPIDFAYAVHTEVGNKMLSAKVNERIVPLEYELKNGEVVEIVTRSNARPSRYWLSLAKTSSARSKIKNWFNRQDKELNVAAGRDLVNRELQVLGKPLLDEKLNVLRYYAGKDRTHAQREQILENVGLGTVTPFQVVKTLHPEETAQVKRKEEVFIPMEYTEQVLVTGEENLPVILSACCKPRPPHAIIGYVTRGQVIRIHHHRCRELSGLDGERFVSALWKEKK